MGCASHERQEYQVPAEHDWAECFDLDPMREIESHEGFVAAPTSLCRSSSICETRRSGRGRTIVVTWVGRFAAPIYFAFTADRAGWRMFTQQSTVGRRTIAC